MHRLSITAFIRLVLVMLLIGSGGTACGQKGPLYLPQSEQAQTQEQ